MPTARRFHLITTLYLAVFAFTGYLLFQHLDSHPLWGDEAETALLAKNVLIYGVPKSFDGVNQITIFGAQVDSNADKIWTWTPWLQEYVAAAGFAIFGQTNWGGRALFVFSGWLSVVLLAVVAFRIYRNHWIALSGALLLGTSELFLLHSRQCRYYGLSLLAEVILIYGVQQLLQQNRKGVLTLALALVIHFYTNYLIAAANALILVALASTLFFKNRKAVLWVAAVAALVFAASLPWLIYARVLHQTGAVARSGNLFKVWQYLVEFNFHFVPWIVALIPCLGWALARFPRRATSPPATPAVTLLEWHLVLLFPCFLAILSLPPDWFLRYLLPLLPVACLLTAAWLFRHVKWPAIALGLVLIQCFTNLFARVGAYPWKYQHVVHSPLLRYLEGTSQPYADRVTDVVQFFKQHGEPGQSVFGFDPEFALIYYTGLKVTDARLNGGQMPNPMPDWILQENASGLKDEPKVFLSGAATQFYDTITIQVHNSRRDAGIPEPEVYQYASAPTLYDFVIYRKKTTPLR